MIQPPDPAALAAGRAYQASLLDALGADDPAVAQAETEAAVRSLLAAAGPDLRTRPEPGEWSVLECVGHLVDAEMVMATRYRFVLAQDEPPLVGYDQAAWPRALHHNDEDPDDLVGIFRVLRAANLRLWARSSDADRARVGRHLERGDESFDLAFRMLGGHDRVHLGQAHRALATVRGESG